MVYTSVEYPLNPGPTQWIPLNETKNKNMPIRLPSKYMQLVQDRNHPNG